MRLKLVFLAAFAGPARGFTAALRPFTGMSHRGPNPRQPSLGKPPSLSDSLSHRAQSLLRPATAGTSPDPEECRGSAVLKRAKWSPPAWAREVSIPVQVALGLGFYIFHTLVLSRHVIPFPVQLIPNESGLFQSIGLDTLAGFLVVASALAWRPWRSNEAGSPWALREGEGPLSLGVGVLLALVHHLSGYLSIGIEYALVAISYVFPLSIPMFRSLTVSKVLLCNILWLGSC